LIPSWQPSGTGDQGEGRRVSQKVWQKPTSQTKSFRTQHVRQKAVKAKSTKARRR
jgi:hypothetical protein